MPFIVYKHEIIVKQEEDGVRHEIYFKKLFKTVFFFMFEIVF
jgi:hypothetical protein